MIAINESKMITTVRSRIRIVSNTIVIKGQTK